VQTAPLDPGSEQEHGWRARWEQARTSTMMSVGVCSTGVPVEASISCSHVHAPRHVSCVRRGPTVREQHPGGFASGRQQPSQEAPVLGAQRPSQLRLSRVVRGAPHFAPRQRGLRSGLLLPCVSRLGPHRPQAGAP